MQKSGIPASYKYITGIMWFFVILILLSVFLIFFNITRGAMGYMPTIEDLANPQSSIASEVISSDHALLGKYYNENRTIVNFDNLSPHLVNALLATEDIRFYKHSGIDGYAMFRVFYGVISGDLKGGGSTISQQLAKNLFPRDSINYKSKLKKFKAIGITKLKEWVTAVKLEKAYTKQEIIALYLNTIPFGSQAFGVQAASRTFFNTTPDSLQPHQAALLVGMLNAPTMYSPLPPLHPKDSVRIRRCERSKARRNVVLGQMNKYGFLSQVETDSLKNKPLGVIPNLQSHDKGLSTYFREFLRITLTAKKPKKENYPSWMMDKYTEDSLEWETNPMYGWCNKNFKPGGEPYNIYNDGLKIYTTIDSRMQQYAEKAVEQHMKLDLQPAFYKEKAGKKKGPFSNQLTTKQVKEILTTSIKRSERYRVYKNSGMEWNEILKAFDSPVAMTVFSWDGDKDTTMTPLDSIRYYKYILNAGLVSVDPKNGHVKAYVGGINYKHFKYDHATAAKRQVGSTFKPFLYTLAMMPGEYSPCYEVPNISVSFKMPEGQTPAIYTPQFSTSKSLKKYEGKMITLKFALAHSLNQISAWVMKQYSPEALIKVARSLGITTYLDPVYSLCVGAAEVRLEEMVGAYTAYANKGIYTEPIYLTRIEDKNGNVIARFNAKRREVFNEETAYRMINLMEGVVFRGTSTRLRYKYKLYNQIAGKTGTTNNNSDGWFIGMVPDLVTGVWVGGEERSIHFDNMNLGQGANMSLPIWAIYMQQVLEDKSTGIDKGATFEKPPFLSDSEFNCELSPSNDSEEDALYDDFRDTNADEDIF